MKNKNEKTSSRTFTLWIKTLAYLLSILLIFYAVPANVYAELIETVESALDNTSEETIVEEVAEEIETKKAVFEVTDRREETVKHFRTEDGSFTAVQYGIPVHEKDENGEWQDIDNTLSESGSEYATPNARVKFAKKTTGNETLFTLHDGNRKITMSLSGANKKVAGQVTNTQTEFSEDATQLQKLMTLDKLSSKILYPDILDGVDLEYVVNSGNIKENIIVKERSDAYSFTFEVKLNNLVAELCEDGSIVIMDPDTEEVVYTIPKGYMYDAAGEYSDEVTYTLTNGGNGKYTLAVTADAEWVNAEGRAFPVTVDPTINLIENVGYQYLYCNNAGEIIDPSGLAYLNITSTQFLYFIAYVGFIPDEAYVTHASIHMTSFGREDAYAPAYFVTSAWSGMGMPNTELGPISSCWHTDTTGIFSSPNPDYLVEERQYSWDLTNAVTRWRSGEPNYGIVIKLESEHHQPLLKLYNKNFDSSDKNPLFIISYVIMDGVEDYWSYASQDMGFAGTGAVNYASGELTYTLSTISAPDYLFGYTPSLVYQSSMAELYYEERETIPITAKNSAVGWHLSTDEALTGSDGGLNSIYTDSDGTRHYIISGKDEDGLGLSVTTQNTTAIITDQAFNKKYFNDISSEANPFEGLINKYEDAFGNALQFERDDKGRVDYVTLIPYNTSSKRQLGFMYGENGLEEIWDMSYEPAVTFEYSEYPNDDADESTKTFLRKAIFHPTTEDSYSVSYTYTNEILSIDPDNLFNIESSTGSVYRLATITDDSTGRMIEYSYDSMGRVVKITEKAELGESVGQTVIFIYQTGFTRVITSGGDDELLTNDDIATTYCFDLAGRVVGVYSSNIHGTTILDDVEDDDLDNYKLYGAASSVYEDSSVTTNGIKTSVVTDGIYTNYLLNGGFDLQDDDSISSQIPYWYTSSGTNITLQYENNRATKEIKVTPATGTLEHFEQFVYLTSGDYMLSFDYKPAMSEDLAVEVSVYNPDNNANIASKVLATSIDGTAETIFDSLHIEINSANVYGIKFQISKSENTHDNAYVVFDNIRLEEGTSCGPYSMIRYGDFLNRVYDNNQTNILYTVDTFWEDIEESNRVSVNEYDALLLSGRYDQKVTASQTVYTADQASQQTFINSGSFRSMEGTYIVSGFGKSEKAVISNISTFMLKVEVEYLNRDGSTEIEDHEFPFLMTLRDWQFVTGSLKIARERFVKEIRVICDYSYQYGSAKFDNISFVRAANNQVMEYSYYNASEDGSYFSEFYGMLKSKTSGYYEETYGYEAITKRPGSIYVWLNGRLICDTQFLYDTNSTLPSQEFYTEYAFDGSFTEEKVTEYTYNQYGLNTKTEIYTTTYSEDNTTQNSKKIRTRTNYNLNANSPIFGAPTATIDPSNHTTCYVYDSATGRLQYEYSSSDHSGVYYTYDFMGRINGVYPLGYTATGFVYYQNTDAESVDLYYGETNELETVSTKTIDYNFEYDAFGNTTSIKIGNTTYASYVYAPNNGKLIQTTYGNGYSEKYVYDHLDRLVELWYTEEEVTEDTVWLCKYRYTYTDHGEQCRIEDPVNNQTTLFRYDAYGKLLGKTITDSQDDRIVYGISYIYDDQDRVVVRASSYDYFMHGVTPLPRDCHENFFYTDTGELEKYIVSENAEIAVTITMGYDELDRLDTYLTDFTGFSQALDYSYKDVGSTGYTTDLISNVTSTINGNTSVTTSYTYDSNYNITKITDSSGNETHYTYDERNQLLREDNSALGQTFVYTYDNAGNRLSKVTYDYTTGSLTGLTPISTSNYSYTTGDWGDQLIYSNESGYASYDQIGNTYYYNVMTTEWTGTRLDRMYIPGLESYCDNIYEYNSDGIRISKTVKGNKHTYVLDGTRIISEAVGYETFIYLYDESGSPIGLRYRGTGYPADVFSNYYFEKNIFGDIVGVYNFSGTKVGTYIYDAWGNCTVQTHSTLSTDKYIVQTGNPFRYRGYYYDVETSLYYLQTRFYDPRTGRFISSDSPGNLGTGNRLIGFNLYAYCGNNPVMGYDPMGTIDWYTFADGLYYTVIGVTAIASAVAVFTVPGAGYAMGVVAATTLVAGTATVLNGVAEMIEASTDYNFVRDGILNGNEKLYEQQKNLFRTIAEVGTEICDAYVLIKCIDCFVAGTLISTETGQIPIEDIEPGMLVWATNPETGETALKPVVQIFNNQTNELVHVTVNGETITCTNEHPFYSPVKGWIAACQLRAGDILVMLNGEYVVVEQVQHELLESPVAIYNFEVEGFHTYYVGDTEVLAHNKCGDSYKPLNEHNYRNNALKYHHSDGIGKHAHHKLPKEFRSYFAQRGINIDSPVYMEVLDAPSHIKVHLQGYNRKWKKFIRDNPHATYSQIIDFMRSI